MMLNVLAGPTLWCWSLGCADPGARSTARAVRELIARVGPTQALSEVFERDEQWSQVVDGIASGSSEWLEIAATFRQVSDAGATEGLAIAMQEALPRNPAGVLVLVSDGTNAAPFTASEVCGGYGLGQVEDQRSARVVKDLVEKRHTIVRRVRVVAGSKARDLCLEELEKLRRTIERLFAFPSG